MNLSADHKLSHWWLYSTVFLTGASVMVVELLGTRLIAPFYGASLYVWASLISVTMIALAIGYYAGGHWADHARRTGLALIIALAGLLTLIIPWMTAPVLLATDSLGLQMGTFTSTLILFTPSLIMLGMVGPFAVKLATDSLSGVGASTGSIYAVSTVGSVVGTLLLGFYLFPRIGSREIFVGVGLGLFVLAALVAFFERKRISLRYSLTPVILLALPGVMLSPGGLSSDNHPASVPASTISHAEPSYQVRFERESLYGWVRVLDNPAANMRLLMTDASTIGAASINHGENLLTYQEIVQLIPRLAPGIERALLIGQGAGHMATNLLRFGITTDTIEIDPAVAEAAQHYFDFKPTGNRIIGDARYEIRKLQGDYDLIILDVFTGGAEPVHLLTNETLQQISGLLSKRGILALNFVSFLDAGENIALASVGKTLAQVFSHQLVFISEPGVNFNDFIFIASQHPLRIEDGQLSRTQQAWLENRLLTVDTRRGLILTDNFNPLEALQARKSEHYRQLIVETVGTSQFVR